MKEEIQELDPFSNQQVIAQNLLDTAKEISKLSQNQLDPTIDYFEQGLKLLEKQQSQLAVIFFKNAIEADTTNDKLSYRIAVTLLEHNRYIEATYFFRKTVVLQPERPDVYYQYGRCLAKLAGTDTQYLKYYGDALSCFDEAIKLNKYYKDAYQGRAIVYRLLGEVQLAISDFKQYDKLLKLESKSKESPTFKKC